jgi:hypothetical protein
MFWRLSDWLIRILKVRRFYRKAFGRAPSLFSPKSFGEKMQWRKLFDNNELFTVFSDKLRVRSFIAERGFGAHLVPVRWSGENVEDLDLSTIPLPFVIKSTHGWHQTIIVTDSNFDAAAIKSEIKDWLLHCHGTRTFEPGYLNVPRRLIVEELLTRENGQPPVEYKLFVFDGVVHVINTIVTETDRTAQSSFHRRTWDRLEWQGHRAPLKGDPPKPGNLRAMIDMAEGLGRGLDHVRVDLYECRGQIYVGEITIYSWRGGNNLKPEKADIELGSYWKINSPATRAMRAIAFSSWGVPRPSTASR